MKLGHGSNFISFNLQILYSFSTGIFKICSFEFLSVFIFIAILLSIKFYAWKGEYNYYGHVLTNLLPLINTAS